MNNLIKSFPLNKEIKKGLLESAFGHIYGYGENIPIGLLRESYCSEINEYLVDMAVYVYNTFYPFATENFDKDDLVLVFKEYFILDASAIQYLQSHGYSFPSQKVINKTSGNIQEIIS